MNSLRCPKAVLAITSVKEMFFMNMVLLLYNAFGVASRTSGFLAVDWHTKCTWRAGSMTVLPDCNLAMTFQSAAEVGN